MQKSIDYSELGYVGIDKSFSASLDHPGDIVLVFERPRTPGSLTSILYAPDLVKVPASQFDRELRDAQRKVTDIKNSWKYRNIINFDTTELDESNKRYESVRVLAEQVKGSLRRVA